VKTAEQSGTPLQPPERRSANGKALFHHFFSHTLMLAVRCHTATELRPLCADGQPMAVKELPENKESVRTSNEVIMTAHEVIAFKAKTENTTPPSSPQLTPASVHSPPVEVSSSVKSGTNGTPQKQSAPTPPKKTKTVIRKSIRPVSRINPITEVCN